jgi:predicted GNAT family acetyltransferase
MIPDIRNNPRAHRFEMNVDGHVAALFYHLGPGVITFTHTEVPPAIGGRGYATHLARHGLDYARAQGLRVVPACPVVSGFVSKHPEYRDLLENPG